MGKYKRRPRLKRFGYTGCHRYFITICTHNKIPVFNNEEIAKRYIGLLAEKAMSLHFKVWAYCFMPDHVHFLAEGMAQDADLKKFVSSFKQSAGYHFRTFIKAKAAPIHGRAKALDYGKMGDLGDVAQGFSPADKAKLDYGKMGGLGDVAQGFSPADKAKLWQPSFYDHVLRKDEDLLEAVKYIFNNPVRKKIVEHYRDYQLSGPFEMNGKL